jgi:AcrR family transcriptional regulator
MADPTQGQTRQERQRQRRRLEIIEAAMRLFARHGYAGTTMQMIAAEAESSVGYLYLHFAGKQRLVTEIVAMYLDRFVDGRQDVIREHAPRPLDTLRALVAYTADCLHDQAPLLPLFVSYEATNQAQLKQVFTRIRRVDAALIQAGIEAGDLRQVEPDATAAVLNGAVRGLINHIAGTGDLEQLRAVPGIIDDLIITPLTRGATGAR